MDNTTNVAGGSEVRESMAAYVPQSLNDTQQQWKHAFDTLIENAAHTISVNAPDCRQKSIALTKLEEAAMWATKSLSHGDL